MSLNSNDIAILEETLQDSLDCLDDGTVVKIVEPGSPGYHCRTTTLATV